MNATELEKELWKVNDELVKAGIKPYEYPTMADAVAELRSQYNRYKALYDTLQRTCDHTCPNCGKEMFLECHSSCGT